jgi:hypothetical protein
MAKLRPGSDVIPSLERLPRVKIRHLPEPPAILRKLPFILFAPFKILQQFIAIFFILFVIIEKPPEFLLVQVGLGRAFQRKGLLLTKYGRIPPVYPPSLSYNLSQGYEEVKPLLTGIIWATAFWPSGLETTMYSSAYPNGSSSSVTTCHLGLIWL